ncbi:MAG: penicillin-binding protein 2 [Spongiibacteraceae bacterium]|nr:penicillin-binding protein 2 [Spongiibacteraceae bacterium]
MVEQEALKDPYTEKRIFVLRVFVASLLALVLLSVLVGRYFSLQITEHDIYRTQSDRNRVQLQPVPPKRGLIYDRNGVLLAENIPSYSLVIVKEQVEYLDETIALLKNLIEIDDDHIKKFQRLLGRRRPYAAVPLKFKLSAEEIAIISVNRYRLPGVDVDAQLARHYPQGEYFAHVLGYVGRISEEEQQRIDEVNYSGTNEIGKVGIEKYYETLLHGKVGHQNVETNARGRVLRVLERTDPQPGMDITLYLDAYLQKAAQDALGNERGSVVAIDPKTGGVLAMVSTPSFDANLFVGGISRRDYSALRDSPDFPLFNRSLQGQYPPGSTIKPFFGLAGLYHEIVTPETKVRDPGWYQLPNDDRLYRDWTWKRRRAGHAPWVALEQAIVESCDTYFWDLAHKLGIDRMHDFIEPFGFGTATGVDSTSERSGLLPSREWKRIYRRQPWFPGETLRVGIGQGYMLATPMQMAVATAVLANRGERFVPRLLKPIGNDDEKEADLPPIELDSAHWDIVLRAMRNVVHSARGTAKKISKGAKYEIAGKSGSVQLVGIAQGEKYNSALLDKRQWDHALFIGFAPLDDPQIAIAVIVENGEGGGSTAAPIGRIVFDAYLLDEKNQMRKRVVDKQSNTTI